MSRMRVQGSILIAAFSVSALFWSGSAIGQETASADDAMARFEAAWATVRQWQPSRGYQYQIRHEMFASMELAEIQSRLSAIEAMPDHPDRLHLERELQRARGVPEVTEIMVWLGADGATRVSQTTQWPGGGRTSSDTVRCDDATWRLTDSTDHPGALVVLDPGGVVPAGRDLAPALDRGVRAIAALAAAGLHADGLYKDAAPRRAELAGNVLVGVASDGRREIVIEFTPVPGQPSPELRPSDLRVMSTDSGREYSHIRLSDWRPGWSSAGGTGELVASRWERLADDGRVLEAYSWLGAGRIEAGAMDALCAIPTPDGTDPLRGPHTFSIVWDYREGAGTYTTMVGGIRSTEPIADSVGPRGGIPRAWNWIGAPIAAGVLAVLVAIRLWKRRTA